MFRNMNLQSRLIGAFLMMGLLVLVVGWVGWSGTFRLNQHITTLSENSLPSVIWLWKINEGQTQIESSERLLLDPRMTDEERGMALSRIEKAWEQINEGFKQYEGTARSEEENKRYKKFQQDWGAWKKAHQRLMELEREYHQLGIRNPWARKAELLSQRKGNPPEIVALNAAIALGDKLDREGASKEEPLFQTATESILAVIEINEEIASAAKKTADNDINETRFSVGGGTVIGSLTAIILGIFLSNAIAKPLDKAISGIVNTIVSSASQIAATVQEHERIATEQASSVSQTTITMDELNASSHQAAQQAEMAAAAARQVAQQVVRLSDRTRQIGSITNLVSELASQTNLLALNAAVEAVRAGEHGKGFAVVASEIRRLADESKKSATSISTLIADIQAIVDSNLMSGEEGKSFESIVPAVNNIVLSSQQISLTAKQQAIANQQVVAAMSAINAGARQTASGITQTKIGTQKLNEAAQNLKALSVG